MNTLFIVATPIGNLEDISIRALDTLFSADVILCEDTRRTGQMIKHYENKFATKTWIIKDRSTDKYPQLVSFYDEIENIKTEEVIEIIKSGKKVTLVSDSGTPLISDPGFKLVNRCITEGIRIDSIPGASAIITALTVSGLPTNSFMFLGFLPPKENARKKVLNELKESLAGIKINPTIICYESPYRIEKLLSDLNDISPDTDTVVVREMTKIHEEVIRGKVSDIISKKPNFKGEITVLFRLK